MLLGLALFLLGAGVLVAMRHSRWPWRLHRAAPEPIEAPPPMIDYEAQPIYVPADKGTIYVAGLPREYDE